jgi:hypothetical protein
MKYCGPYNNKLSNCFHKQGKNLYLQNLKLWFGSAANNSRKKFMRFRISECSNVATCGWTRVKNTPKLVHNKFQFI